MHRCRNVSGEPSPAPMPPDGVVILHPAIKNFVDALAAWRFRRAVMEGTLAPDAAEIPECADIRRPRAHARRPT